jgi:hypothetical protein
LVSHEFGRRIRVYYEYSVCRLQREYLLQNFIYDVSSSPTVLSDSREISSFKGSAEIGTLTVQLLDENAKSTFKDIGKTFVGLTGRHRHRDYEGFMIQHTGQDPSSRPSFQGSSDPPGFGLRSSPRSRTKNGPTLLHFQVSHLCNTELTNIPRPPVG